MKKSKKVKEASKAEESSSPSFDIAESPEYDEMMLKQKAEVLMDAEEIKSDSKLMAALQPYLEKKSGHINSIAGLKKRRDELLAEEAGEEPEA